MSFKNMTADELNLALKLFGFPRRKAKSETGRPSEGYTECGLWLQTLRGGDRIARYGKSKSKVPVELAYLFRLMRETGYTPEMVENLPPITEEISTPE